MTPSSASLITPRERVDLLDRMQNDIIDGEGLAVVGERVRALAVAVTLMVLLSAVVGSVISLLVPDFAQEIRQVLAAGPPLQSVTSGMNFIEDGDSSSAVDDVGAGMHLALFGMRLVSRDSVGHLREGSSEEQSLAI